MFPCSYTFSECFRTVIFRILFPCSQKLANVPLFPSIFCQYSLVPQNPWETLTFNKPQCAFQDKNLVRTLCVTQCKPLAPLPPLPLKNPSYDLVIPANITNTFYSHFFPKSYSSRSRHCNPVKVTKAVSKLNNTFLELQRILTQFKRDHPETKKKKKGIS